MYSIIRPLFFLLAMTIPLAAIADETDIYCLQGGSTSVPIPYTIYHRASGAVGNTVGFYPIIAVPATPVSGNTSGIRTAWITSINGTASSIGTITAAVDFTDPVCPGWDTAFSVTYTGTGTVFMSAGASGSIFPSCSIGYFGGTTTSGICSVNPEIVQASGPAPPDQPFAQVPALGFWPLAGLIVLLTMATWWSRRRGKSATP